MSVREGTTGVRGAKTRASAVVGIALAQLRRSPGRTVLTVLAVMLAVLSMTLLAGLGVGVIEKGEEGLQNANRDIWISNDPVDRSASGTENPIDGAHGTIAEINQREDIRSASPIAMHEVYVGTDPGSLERYPAVGVQETHDRFNYEAGGGFEFEAANEAAARRSDELQYGEIILDPRIAKAHDAEVGDTIYVGTSRETAPEYEFTVVGISAYHSQFLGSQAITVPFADLQTVAGTSGTDRATFITAEVTEDADRDAVRDDLAAEYPDYDVRTSDEQVESMIEDRPVIIASGATLIVLAVVGGIALTVNVFALATARQRGELAALRAIGLSRWLLAGTIAVQGVVVGVLGGLAGLLATRPIADGLNALAASVVGFDNLLQTSPVVYAIGFVLAIVVGTIVAAITGWRAGRYARIEHLKQ
ncbi:ABC transporter permease [Halosolutus gelatinilyticus]|uniref:ABC transporter permease n=1 Tax=Halosolutus gelatinilyticus TaxID=2931975 RepID=UPI001FF0FEC4|nr:ABC transporter permease [Halosolutus gelatinilyticus]